MNIVVKSITDLKTPQPCHGKNLANLARECFVNHQTLTVNFDGVNTITNGFFQAFILPLLAEYGADFLKSQLMITNVTPDIDETMKSCVYNLDDYFEQRAIILNKECDADINELNLAWLIKARELARENPLLAELTMGISDEALRSAISQLSIEDIRHIAQSGWLCFSPRFTTNFIQTMSTRQHEVIDVLLELSGSL